MIAVVMFSLGEVAPQLFVWRDDVMCNTDINLISILGVVKSVQLLPLSRHINVLCETMA